jgi:hypothetical protein
MASSPFIFYCTPHERGLGTVSMLGPSLGKTTSLQNPKGLSSGEGRWPKIDHLHEPVEVSSSRGALENKKSLKIFKVCPRHPPRIGASRVFLARPLQLKRALLSIDAQASVGNPIPLARGRPYMPGSKKTKAALIILQRRSRSGGPRQALHLTSNPRSGVGRLWAVLSVNAFVSVRVPASLTPMKAP